LIVKQIKNKIENHPADDYCQPPQLDGRSKHNGQNEKYYHATVGKMPRIQPVFSKRDKRGKFATNNRIPKLRIKPCEYRSIKVMLQGISYRLEYCRQ
jgi:hypothetical protein